MLTATARHFESGRGPDVVVANDDVDEIVSVFLGGGADLFMAARWNTEVSGGPGDDILLGGEGLDRLSGGCGRDFIYGGDFMNTLHGGAGDDIVLGGPDSDWISGADGDDLLIGGPGNDVFIGSTGADRLHGGDGQDTFDFKAGCGIGPGTVIDGGPGDDQLRIGVSREELDALGVRVISVETILRSGKRACSSREVRYCTDVRAQLLVGDRPNEATIEIAEVTGSDFPGQVPRSFAVPIVQATFTETPDTLFYLSLGHHDATSAPHLLLEKLNLGVAESFYPALPFYPR